MRHPPKGFREWLRTGTSTAGGYEGMQIIGEKINGTRKRVNEAVTVRDGDFIRNLAREQVETGADLLDVNAGTTPDREPEDLVWLVNTIQSAVDTPLCLDSPNPVALKAALEGIKRQPMINSISGEAERLDHILPIVAEQQCMVIALALDGTGIPKSVGDRLKAVKKAIAATRGAGVPDDKVYVDPLIMTVATDSLAGVEALKAIRAIRGEYPEVHITCGLSNISFGLPGRSQINRTFLSLAMEAGLDSAIVDPTNQELRESLLITEMLLGRDPFCRKYTKAFRSGIIGKAT
jgi:5-methyltetrahydrofolate corrinoid/iron sulfur protein methyltransferase